MKRFTQLTLLVAFAVALCHGARSDAAVISVQPVVGGYFTTSFDPAPDPGPMEPGYPLIVQVDVMMEVLSLAPGEDSFGLAAFSFEISDGLCKCDIKIAEDAGGWFPNPIPGIDSNGPAPGGIVPPFALNGDFGVSDQDLKGVLIQMATGAFTNAADIRRNIGEAGSPLGVPILLGSAFFEWNGLGYGEITLNPVEVAIKLTNGVFVAAQAAPVIPAQVGPADCPEPSTLVLLASCFVGMSFRRRAS